MLAETSAELSDWAVMWAIVGVSAALLLAFFIYRLTGGKWPDDEYTNREERCRYCKGLVDDHSRDELLECTDRHLHPHHWLYEHTTTTTKETPSDGGV